MNEFLGKNLRYLRKLKGLTQDQLANKIGVNRAMIGSYEEGRAIPKLPAMRVLARYFDVNVDELVNYDLSLREDQKNQKDLKGAEIRVISTIVDRDKKELVTLVPIKASAGYLNGYGDPDFIENLPRFSLPLPELSKERTYRVFQIKGDSMTPIPSGSYIIGEYIQNWLEIKDGKTYIIVTNDEGIVYKRAYHGDKGELILKSDNPEYETYSIHLKGVSEIWKALGYISLSLPEPNEITINRLTLMVHEMKNELEEIKRNR